LFMLGKPGCHPELPASPNSIQPQFSMLKQPCACGP
jgi:hypothetical protein